MNEQQKRWINRGMWIALVVTVAATLTWRLACRGSVDGEVKWQCVPDGPRQVACAFKADADAGGFCFDLVLPCDDGEHRAEVCSGPLEANVSKAVDVGELEPPLPAAPVCGKPRYENRRTPEP